MLDDFFGSYRVLDLTDEEGFLCGKLLGDLGADVIKVERPGGDPARSAGSFYGSVPDRRKSLYWFAYNANKRGITLSLDNPAGREIFKRLVRTADFVIESHPPGYLSGLGLGYADLSDMSPGLIMTSITPFGQDGPRSQHKGSNLVAEATGGLMYITGNAEGRPMSTSYNYAYSHAGLQAATATLIANYWRQRTGRGQHVDLSIQEAVLVTLYNPQTMWYDSRVVQGRYGGKLLRNQGVLGGLVFPCQDGYVLWRLMTAHFTPRLTPLVKWMAEEGMADELVGIDWARVDMSKTSQQQQDAWEEVFARFFLARTKAELYAEAIKRGIMLFPVNDAGDILKDPQLEARGFWEEVEHPELGTSLTYAGVPFKMSGFTYRLRRAPLVGEHNEEVYCRELGLSGEELASLKEQGAV
ncbi:MAG: CoA transferase [Chloroflexota bacterium]